MKYILSNSGFEPLPKVFGLITLGIVALSAFWHAIILVGLVLAFLNVALFPVLKRFSFYSGEWGNRPVWSMNRHRTNVLIAWRLYRHSRGCSREVMASMLAAHLRDQKKS
jgi:hypothetical protein